MARLAALLLVVLACAGCGLDDDLLGSGPSSPEIRWLERYGAWRIEYGDTLDAVASGNVDAANLQTCTTSFDAAVGRAPELYRPVESLVRRGCRHYERGAEVDSRITPTTDPGPLLVERDAAIAKADDLFARADYEIERRLHESSDVPVTAKPTEESHVDPRLGEAASTIVHRDVQVRCWSDDDWRVLSAETAALRGEDDIDYAGFVGIDNERLHLAAYICEPAARLAYDGEQPDRGGARFDLAFSVLALAHEAGHLLAPAAAEAEVECQAIQRMPALAQELGADSGYARELAELAWEEIYPENDAEYRSSECRDGGALDLNRATARWP